MSYFMNIEQEIKDKDLTAPRVTLDDIEANIVSEHYFTAGDGVFGSFISDHLTPDEELKVGMEKCEGGDAVDESLDYLTFCVLVLKNGFTVTGESACASPENFDAEIGKKIARQNAVAKIWPLMGYELKTKLNV